MFSTNAFLEIPSHYDILFFLFFCRFRKLARKNTRTKDDVFFYHTEKGRIPHLNKIWHRYFIQATTTTTMMMIMMIITSQTPKNTTSRNNKVDDVDFNDDDDT